VAIVADEAAANPGLPAMQAALALIYCEIGEPDRAREQFEELTDRHHELLHDLSWLVMTSLLADVCFQLDDAQRAEKLHRALSPYRAQCIDNGTNWFGSVGHYLAMLEHVMGRFDDADASFRAAVEWHARMPAPLLLARTEIDWAVSLLRRPVPERDHASRLIASSRSAASELGLGRVLARATELSQLL
jgi:hypothetical protein